MEPCSRKGHKEAGATLNKQKALSMIKPAGELTLSLLLQKLPSGKLT